ncbi:MAG: cytochrome c peroxidase [Polyangiales bacterium]
MSKRLFGGARARVFAWSTVSAACVLGSVQTARAQLTPPAIPELDEGAGIIANKQIAIALGKALFWDQMAGSDGVACATCHFSAGADSRIKSQLSPGLLDTEYAGGDSEFGSTHSDTGRPLGRMPSGGIPDAAYTLTKQDFPLHQLEDYKNRNSPILTTTNDVVSSSGAYAAEFYRVGKLIDIDVCGPASGSVFHAGKFPARQVEPRNTPTTINAGFFYLNFWDGRANNLFNGIDPFGLRTVNGDKNKRLIVLDGATPKLGHLTMRNASLASQAVGPALSEIEMSCAGRQFIHLAEKLLDNAPLMLQEVSPNDSVLAPYVRPPIRLFGMPISVARGLHPQYSYKALIQQAFDKKYWGAPGKFRIADGKLVVEKKAGNTQMELNFSMFWGVAIMMYERTLISDQSRFDTWYASCRPNVSNSSGRPNEAPIGNPTVVCVPDASNAVTSTDPVAHGLTAQEVLGFGMFMNAGVGPRNNGNPSCVGCHGPVGQFNPNAPPPAGTRVTTPLFTEAGFTAGQTFNPVERSLITDRGFGLPPIVLPTAEQVAGAVHDRGFFNIGVTPTSEDLGIGGRDPYGQPLSLARMFLGEQAGQSVFDPPVVVFPPGGTPLATVTTSINRCTSPGMIELGGTPRFLGCAGNPIPAFPEPLLLDIAQERELVDGGFKTPSLRNVGLTAPYFHTGNYADLRSVMQFYSRGGSHRIKALTAEGVTGDTSGTGPLGKGLGNHGGHFGTNVDFFMRDVKMTDEQIDALVAFMLSLTDPRVQCDVAPFDHPQLYIPIGHSAVDRLLRDGRADEVFASLPAVGAAGYAKSSGLCLPNKGDLFAPGAQGRVGGQRIPLP